MKISLSSAGLAAMCLSTALVSQDLPSRGSQRSESAPSSERHTLPLQDFSEVDRTAPAPGMRPGTQSWNVLLQGRPFDLSELQRAHREGISEQGAKALLERLDNAARDWHTPVHEVVERFGGQVIYDLWLVDAVTVEVPPEALPALRELPQVRELQPDAFRAPGAMVSGIGRTGLRPNDTSTDRNHHNAVAVHAAGNRGTSQWIALLDTGFDMNDTSETRCFEARANRTFYENGTVTCLVPSTGGLPLPPFPFPTPRTGVGESRMQFISQIGQQPSEMEDVHGTFVASIAAGETWGPGANAGPGHAPDALMTGYALSVLPGGLTIISRQAFAFQRLTADALFFPIRVANMSYESGSTPSSLEVMAMDEAANVADLLIVVETGNGGPLPLNGAAVASALNGLVVGAVEPFNRRIASFSPTALPLITGREYPDLVADGVNVWGALANSDQDAIASGTSFAAPQVAGAAALFFERRPTASALEARAALLATTEDLRASNGGTSAGVGAGYLRDDRLDLLASGAGLLDTGTLPTVNTPSSFSLPVSAGQEYTIAVTWARRDVSRISPARLRVRALENANVLASLAPLNSSRAVLRVIPSSTGMLDIEVDATAFEPGQTSVDFAVAVSESVRDFVAAERTDFGASCGPNRLIVDQPAMIGDTHRVFPEFAVPGGNAVTLLVGSSNTQSPLGPLPINLGPTNCQLLVSAEITLPISGGLATPIQVPQNPSLLGARLFEQLVILDNTLQTGAPFYVTQGVRLSIGGSR